MKVSLIFLACLMNIAGDELELSGRFLTDMLCACGGDHTLDISTSFMMILLFCGPTSNKMAPLNRLLRGDWQPGIAFQAQICSVRLGVFKSDPRLLTTLPTASQ
jgi:hypothetical protein